MIDWMSGFLEEHVRPSDRRLYGTYVRTWANIYEQWASDAVHDGAAFDTAKCQRWIALAEEHLQNLASSWNRRFLLKAVRAFPLRMVCLLLKTWDQHAITETVQIATIAVLRFSTPADVHTFENGDTSVRVTQAELSRMKSELGPTLAGIFAAAHAVYVGRGHYRWAGKGYRIRPPARNPGKALKTEYDLGSIVLLRAPELEPVEVVKRAVSLYEARKRTAGATLSGFAIEDAGEPAERALNWWAIQIPMHRFLPRQVRVRYRKLDLTTVSGSYFAAPVIDTDHLQILEGFVNEFPRCYGLTFEQFHMMTLALTRLIARQTEYAAFTKFDDTSGDEFVLDSKTELRPAVGFLYELFSQGMLRNTKEAFLRALGDHYEQQGGADRDEVVQVFVDRFTAQGVTFDPMVRPHLFYQLDDTSFVLDCLAMPSFFELCLAEVTCGDDAPGNMRADFFEAQARRLLTDALGLRAHDLPVPPNRSMKFPERDYGDVDFAFYWKGALFNLDMKSWQIPSGYLRGDHNAVVNRQRVFVAQLEKVDRRGAKLIEIVERADPTRTPPCVNLLCVPSPPYLSLLEPDLWYGEHPRVMTWSEIAALLKDEKRCADLVAEAARQAHKRSRAGG